MGLRDKASKIDFASLTAAAAASADAKQPKTAPGAMMAFANDARSDLLRENEELKNAAARSAQLEAQLDDAMTDLRSWDGAKAVRLLDPKEVAPSKYANRHQSSFAGEEFDRLKRDISEAGGNVQPIKVRPIARPSTEHKYEIVFGHRRHAACFLLGIPVLALVDNLDDRSLFVEMERENREREDLSPWEQGMMYARALDSGLFSSNRQLAAAVGVDLSNVGKSLALARLPDYVVQAFRSPVEIQLRWAPLLNRLLEQDLDGVKQRAEDLASQSPKLSGKEVMSRLTAPSSNTLEVGQGKPRQVTVNGRKAATLAFDADGKASIRIHVALRQEQRKELENALHEFLSKL